MGVKSTSAYYPNGNKMRENWYLEGICHRVDGPATIYYYASGKIEREVWYLNGQLHRIDGPAIIDYSELYGIRRERWYLNNEDSTHKEWLIEKKLYNKPYNIWTDEEKVLWKLSCT